MMGFLEWPFNRPGVLHTPLPASLAQETSLEAGTLGAALAQHFFPWSNSSDEARAILISQSHES